MGSIYEPGKEWHKIEAVLYPNHLPTGGPGTFLAKNTKEKTIGIEAICGEMKTRGGYDGSYDDAIKTSRHFLKETMYQLCDGFSVNLDWFTINVAFNGLFHSPKEPFTPPKHKVTFSFHMLKAMRELTSNIEVVVNGHIEDPAFIAAFRELDEGLPLNSYTLDSVCEITGQRLKIEGSPAVVGLWMVPVLDPTKAKKVSRILRNEASMVEFLPEDTGFAENRLELRTFYSGGSILLNTARKIQSNFTINRA